MEIEMSPKPETRLFVGGDFVESAEGARFITMNPATGAVLAEVSEAGRVDVDRAVSAARDAFAGSWGALLLSERARLLRALAQLMDERRGELALLESLDAGKPIADAQAQVGVAIEWIDWFADMATKVRSHVIPGPSDVLNYTLRQPVGVVGCITPWNYPLVLYAIKVAPALAMGNTVLLKPAEQTPLTALAFAELAAAAGLPPGTLSVLPGYGPTTGRAIVEHPDVAMISFTGSTAVGRAIAAACGRGVKKATLELGGKSPNLIFADADLDFATTTALFSFSVNQGQLCSAGTRLLVEESVLDEVLDALIAKAEELRIGDPLDPETQLGAIISEDQLARIEFYVEAGASEGASLKTGGERPPVEGHAGWFYRPTVFSSVQNTMRIAQEEIFGPVLSVISFQDEPEAVSTANDIIYGLAAGIWTRDLSRAHRVAASISAGLVYVNTMNLLSPASPYSGFKQSGAGVEGGFEQCESFTELKSVWVNLANEAPRF